MSCHAAVRPNPRPPKSTTLVVGGGNFRPTTLSPNVDFQIGGQNLARIRELKCHGSVSGNVLSCLKILILKSVLRELSDITTCDAHNIMPSFKATQMFWIVLVGDKVRGLYSSGCDAAERCKQFENARVVMLRSNEDCDE